MNVFKSSVVISFVQPHCIHELIYVVTVGVEMFMIVLIRIIMIRLLLLIMISLMVSFMIVLIKYDY